MNLSGALFYISIALALYVVYRIYLRSAALRYSSPFKRNAVLSLRALCVLSLLLAYFDVKIPLGYSGINYIVIIDNSYSMNDNIAKAVRLSSEMLEKLLKAQESLAQYISYGARAAVE